VPGGQEIERRVAGIGVRDVEALAFDHRLQEAALRRVVVDDEYGFGHHPVPSCLSAGAFGVLFRRASAPLWDTGREGRVEKGGEETVKMSCKGAGQMRSRRRGRLDLIAPFGAAVLLATAS
jgi:hypothetical protein